MTAAISCLTTVRQLNPFKLHIFSWIFIHTLIFRPLWRFWRLTFLIAYQQLLSAILKAAWHLLKLIIYLSSWNSAHNSIILIKLRFLSLIFLQLLLDFLIVAWQLFKIKVNLSSRNFTHNFMSKSFWRLGRFEFSTFSNSCY